MGSAGLRGRSGLRKRRDCVMRAEHGVREPAPAGPMPSPGPDWASCVLI